MTSYFLVTGMFRSGTTLLARLLHANKNIICASDPYAPVFKAYRNHYGSQLIPNFDGESPLHDYYFDKIQNDLFRKMQSEDFGVPLASGFIEEIKPKIRKHCGPYSPLLHDHLHLLKGNTFSELFRSGLQAIERAYYKDNAQAIGFKEVWVGEFAAHFLRLASDTKVIHIVRDPRAIVASNFVSGARYPLFFLARQWRKLASLAWFDADRSDKVKLIRFEDLVASPETVTKEICAFLGVDFDEEMIDVGNLKDGAGKSWRQNTSHQDAQRMPKQESEGFNSVTAQKWRTVLPEQHIKLTEKLCYFEMKLCRYPLISTHFSSYEMDDGLLFKEDDAHLAGWIKPYSTYSYLKEMATENIRHNLMIKSAQLDETLKELFVLVTAIYPDLISSR